MDISMDISMEICILQRCSGAWSPSVQLRRLFWRECGMLSAALVGCVQRMVCELSKVARLQGGVLLQII